MSVTIDRLTPEGKRLFDELKKLKSMEVRVGFQAGKVAEEDGTDLCDIATWNELGTATIPSRPFLRQSVENNQSLINTFCREQTRCLLQGSSAADVMKQIGVMQKGLIQETIESGDFNDNAPSTIKNKSRTNISAKKHDPETGFANGDVKPLIHSGTMRQSVNYVITKKGDGEQ